MKENLERRSEKEQNKLLRKIEGAKADKNWFSPDNPATKQLWEEYNNEQERLERQLAHEQSIDWAKMVNEFLREKME